MVRVLLGDWSLPLIKRITRLIADEIAWEKIKERCENEHCFENMNVFESCKKLVLKELWKCQSFSKMRAFYKIYPLSLRLYMRARKCFASQTYGLRWLYNWPNFHLLTSSRSRSPFRFEYKITVWNAQDALRLLFQKSELFFFAKTSILTVTVLGIWHYAVMNFALCPALRNNHFTFSLCSHFDFSISRLFLPKRM